LEWVIDFNQFDLYTKSDEKPDIEKLWPYYQDLIDEFMPGKLDW
jgi:inositol oxygenase